MQKYELGTFYWRENRGNINYPIAGVLGGIGFQTLKDIIGDSDLDPDTKLQTAILMDQAKELVEPVLKQGAVITGGTERSSIKPGLPDIDPVTAVNLAQKFFIRNGRVTIVAAGIDQRLTYRVGVGGQLVFGLVGNEVIYPFNSKVLNSIDRTIDELQPQGSQRIISSSSVITQVMFDLANSSGKGVNYYWTGKEQKLIPTPPQTS